MSLPSTNLNAGPNWYADPADPTLERYWDGATWTAHVRPLMAPAAPVSAGSTLSTITYVMAVLAFLFSPLLFGLIGLGTGLAARNRGEVNAQRALTVLGVAALAGWIVNTVLFAGGFL